MQIYSMSAWRKYYDERRIAWWNGNILGREGFVILNWFFRKSFIENKMAFEQRHNVAERVGVLKCEETQVQKL